MIERIGICCTGNSCRSPIMGIWLESLIAKKGITVNVWTAGIKIDENICEMKHRVEPYAIEASVYMNLDETLLAKLKEHTIKRLSDITEKTDLIFWITELHMTVKIDENKAKDKKETNDEIVLQPTRFRKMQDLAKKLGSALIIITEKDFAYEAKVNYERKRDLIKDELKRIEFITENEPAIKLKYLQQGMLMKEWSDNIYKMI